MTLSALHGADVRHGTGVHIGQRTRIVARSIRIGDHVTIGDDVTISCDVLEIGADTRIGDRVHLLSPAVSIGERCRIGSDVSAEAGEQFRLGRLCDVGNSVRIVAHAMVAGDHLWMTDFVRVGGGGARGAQSRLTLGQRCAIMDGCFLNVSEAITVGDETAFSNGVTVLTHSLWQPVLDGGTAQFAPVKIGSRCILYVNAVVAPGVAIGNDVTVGAGAVVLQHVPDASTALGNPARVMKSTPAVPRALGEPRQDEIVREILRAWTHSLPLKGCSATFDSERDVVSVRRADDIERVWFQARDRRVTPDKDVSITLAFGPQPAGTSPACHFDLSARTLHGNPSPVAEDLRDFLRRRTIRIYTDRPFSSLLPEAIERLRRQLQSAP